MSNPMICVFLGLCNKLSQWFLSEDCDEIDSVSRLDGRLSHTFLPHKPIQSPSLIPAAVSLFHCLWERLSISRCTTEREIQG